MSNFFKGFGEYPPEYDRAVHGPYNPSVYYGKRDTPFGDVKLKDLFSWIGRRNKSPRAMAQAISRSWFKYQIAWVSPKKAGAAFLYQFIAATSLFYMILDYDKYKNHRSYRYH